MTYRVQRIIIWVVAVLLVGGTALALRYARGYRPLAGIPERTSDFPEGVAIRFRDIRVVGRDQGRVAWTLTAAQIDAGRDRSRITFLGGIEAELLSDKGEPSARIRAAEASYNELLRSLEVSGGIECVVQDLHVGTEKVLWDAGSNTIRCPGEVTARTGVNEVSGEDLTVDMSTRDFELRNVRARFYVDLGGE